MRVSLVFAAAVSLVTLSAPALADDWRRGPAQNGAGTWGGYQDVRGGGFLMTAGIRCERAGAGLIPGFRAMIPDSMVGSMAASMMVVSGAEATLAGAMVG